MEATFPLDEHNIKVIYTWYGAEKYYLDNKLIDKKWNLSFRGTRALKVGENLIEIKVSITPKDYYCKVYKNGELYIEELFPEIRDKIKKRNKEGFRWKIFFKSFFKSLSIWLIIGLAMIIAAKVTGII